VAALVTVLAVVAGFSFISREPSTGPIYGTVQNQNSALTIAGNAYYGIEPVGRSNALPVPVARTVVDMRQSLRDDHDSAVHVFVHGANIKVVFPHGPAVCVTVPPIVDSGQEPVLAPC
jgi:hypothetical protein